MSNHVLPWRIQLPVRRLAGFTPVTDFDEPFREIDHFLDRLFRSMPAASSLDELPKFTPTLDLHETEKSFEINLEVPGMSANDVDISITKDVLTISGEKKEEKEEGKKGLYRLERRYGSFSRSIPLPDNCVDIEGVEAACKDGILTITLPKRVGCSETVKKIPISTSEKQQVSALAECAKS